MPNRYTTTNRVIDTKDNMHLVSSKRQRDREFEAWLTRVRF